VTTHHPDFFTGHLISYYAAAQNNLGIEYANAGDWRRAIAHYQAALRLEPDQSAAQRNLAFALQKKPKLL
jgi:tetratricopeptide (TPR) repeat protein